jgi:hypothetical protein
MQTTFGIRTTGVVVAVSDTGGKVLIVDDEVVISSAEAGAEVSIPASSTSSVEDVSVDAEQAKREVVARPIRAAGKNFLLVKRMNQQ